MIRHVAQSTISATRPKKMMPVSRHSGRRSLSGSFVIASKDEKTETRRLNDSLGACGDAELAQDAVEVELHRVIGDAQTMSDFLVREAAGEKLRDLLLAWSKWLDQVDARPRVRHDSVGKIVVDDDQPVGH